MPAADRHLAAILFTDIVGFSGLMQHNEEDALRMIRRYRQVLEEQVGKSGGVILNDYGDGDLCSFPSAVEAVHCAVSIQHVLQQEPVVPLRIGVHIGEVFVEHGKALGDGVNVASRVQSLGIANSVLLSSDVYRVIRNHPEFRVQRLGKFDFKNIDDPVEVFALENDRLAIPDRKKIEGKLKVSEKGKQIWFSRILKSIVILLVLIAGAVVVVMILRSRQGNPAEVSSIAVLPFVNISEDESQEYFSNGITEDIVNSLSRLSGIRVKSRTSTLLYRGSSKSSKEIGEELNVTHLLEGSVRKIGNNVRIGVQLIDARQDEQVWSASYDRELEDILALQNDIAQNISRSLQLELNASEKASMDHAVQMDITAYDYFLKAREEYNHSTYERRRYDNALQLVNEALSLQPDYAQALALKGRIWFQFATYGIPMKVWRDSSLTYATRSIEADPQLPDGYICRAFVRRYVGEIKDARADLNRAYRLAPNNPEVLLAYGNRLLEDRIEGGAEMIVRSIEAYYSIKDPNYFETWDDVLYNTDNLPIREKLLLESKKLYPGSIEIRYELAGLYSDKQEYENSIREYSAIQALFPEAGVEDGMAWQYFWSGNYEKAIEYWSAFGKREATFTDTAQRLVYRHRLGMAYNRVNKKQEADSLIREQHKITTAQLARARSIGTTNPTWGSRAGFHYDLAVCEAYFGNRDKMLQHLDSAVFHYHFFWIKGIKQDPMWEAYQSDEKFMAFQKRFQEVVDFRKRTIEKALYNTEEGKRLLRLINWPITS